MLTFNNFFPPEVIAFVSDRKIDFSLNRNNPLLTDVQRKFLASCLSFCKGAPEGKSFDLNNVCRLVQVHGQRIILLRENHRFSQRTLEEADGIVTNLNGFPLAVRTADCLPIFFYASTQKCIGLIHAGWRGTNQGIVKEAIKMMAAEYRVTADEIKVSLGPAIRHCCYRVGKEIKDCFPGETLQRGDNYYFDLPLANIHQLMAMGVREKNIFDCGVCTYCDINYFSYRREGDASGRMISFMMMRS